MSQYYDLNNTGPQVQDRLDQTQGNKQDIATLEDKVTAIENEIGESGQGGNTINARLDALETAVGSGGSVDERIAAAETEIIGGASSDYNTLGKVEGELEDTYRKNETYSKTELDNLITTPNVQYVTVIATSGTTDVTTLLPATGAADTVYRVGNWDGTQYDATMYALYAWNGTAYVCLAVRSFVGEVYDVSVNHPDGQGNPTPYANLKAALGNGGANVPQSLQRGGMSVKFVRSSDNRYVQHRCMAQNFTTDVTQWQGVDDVPTAGSNNLVESGGVQKVTDNLKAAVGQMISISTAIENDYFDTNVIVKNGDSFIIKIEAVNTFTANVLIDSTAIPSSGLTNDNNEKILQATADGNIRLYFGSSTIEQNASIYITTLNNLYSKIEEVDSKNTAKWNELIDSDSLLIRSEIMSGISGGYYDVNGVLQSASGYYLSPIDISDYAGKNCYIEVSLPSIKAGSGRCTLITDANGNVIEYIKEQYIPSDGNVYKIHFDIPSNAKYLKISYRNNVQATVSTSKSIIYPDESQKFVYVDPTNGSDNNEGTLTEPFKSLGKALENNLKVKLLDGIYNENNIIVPNGAEIEAINNGKAVFLLDSHVISREEGTLSETGIYQLPITASMPSSLNSVTFIYQYGVDDLTTEISDAYRLPIHGERQYRCDFSALERKTSLADVRSSETPAFYVDIENSILYYKRSSAVTSSTFLFTPSQSDNLFNGKKFKVNGLKIYGMCINLSNSEYVELTDCSVFAASGVAGGYIFDDAKEIICRRCEVARVNGAIGNNGGDGFNGHTTNGNVTNITLDDCWAHDCWNDGCSMHEDVYIIINGGCYEYNCIGGVGAGITPAAGIKTVIKDALCQCNHEGDGVKYSANTYGNYASVECFNVVSRNNENGFYISNVTGNVTMTLINCVSYGNKKWGYKSQKIATCINCKSANNPSGDYNGCTVI